MINNPQCIKFLTPDDVAHCVYDCNLAALETEQDKIIVITHTINALI